MIDLAVMLNNYFHDLATALLLTSGVAVYYLAKTAEATNDRGAIIYFIKSYQKLTTLGRIAFVWILAAGVVRLINYENFEWANAAGANQVPVLIVKHILMFTIVGLGIYAWRRLNQKVNNLKQSYEIEKASDPKSLPVNRQAASGSRG